MAEQDLILYKDLYIESDYLGNLFGLPMKHDVRCNQMELPHKLCLWNEGKELLMDYGKDKPFPHSIP